MTGIVISGLRHYDRHNLVASFTVELDGVVVIRRCQLVMSLFHGRPILQVPRRGNGSPIIGLSDALPERIADAAAAAYADSDFPSDEAAA